MVTKDELLEVDWPGVTVTEELAHAMHLRDPPRVFRLTLAAILSALCRGVGYVVRAPGAIPDASRDARCGKLARSCGVPASSRCHSGIVRRGHSHPLEFLDAYQTGRCAFGGLAGPSRLFSRGPTVAVLPFENSTGDATQDPLAEGLTQGMISALGRFGELRVLARGVTSSYRGRVANAIDLGRALGVDYAVDGNLRQDGEVSRVDIRLSDARTGAQVWSRSFEASVANKLATEDEISGKVSAMIGGYWGAIGTAEYKRIQTKSSRELTSYECIVQGVIGTATDVTVPEPVAKARDCLERLTGNAPGNATAWAARVLVFNTQRNWGFALPPEQAASVDRRLYLATKALETANRAIELAPNDALVRADSLPVLPGWRVNPIWCGSRQCERSRSTQMIRRFSVRSATSWRFRVFGTKASRSPKRGSP